MKCLPPVPVWDSCLVCQFVPCTLRKPEGPRPALATIGWRVYRGSSGFPAEGSLPWDTSRVVLLGLNLHRVPFFPAVQVYNLSPEVKLVHVGQKGMCVCVCVRNVTLDDFSMSLTALCLCSSGVLTIAAPAVPPGSGCGSLEILHLSHCPPSYVDTAHSPSSTHCFPEA